MRVLYNHEHIIVIQTLSSAPSVSISKRFDSMKLLCIIFNCQCGVVIYGGTMLPGCGKKHTNLSAGSPFEVHNLYT